MHVHADEPIICADRNLPRLVKGSSKQKGLELVFELGQSGYVLLAWQAVSCRMME